MLSRDKYSSFVFRFLPMAFFFVFAMAFYCVDVSATISQEESDIIKDHCTKKHPQQQNPQQQNPQQQQDVDNCINDEARKLQALKRVFKCSKKLLNDYEIEEDTLEKLSSKDEDEDEDEDEIDSGITLVKLKRDCSKEKQSTEECCSNPNSCNGFALDIAQHVLPLAPGLFSAYKSYKISDKASKGELTHQEAVDKMCNAQNTVAMGAFATGLLSQLAPMFQKTCGKGIAKCKKACNSKVDEFKREFNKCYKEILPNKNILHMQKFAKDCLGIDQVNLIKEDFELNPNPNNYEYFTSHKDNSCFFNNNGKGFQKSNSGEENLFKEANRSALAWLLYIAKAYKNTSIGRGDNLSNNSDEEEIIDCGNQTRMLSNSSKPGGPLPPPAIQMCQQAVEHAVKHQGNPPPMPQANSPRNQRQIQQAGSLTGHTKGATPSALQIPAGSECEYGVVDSAKLEDCTTLRDMAEDFDESSRQPSLATNLPGWKDGSGSGGSPSSAGGGGGVSGGAGSLGGNDDSMGRGSAYGPYNGDMSTGANFGSYDSPVPYGSDGGQGGSSRDIAESSDDPVYGESEMPLDEQYGDREKTIFQIASERIQNFCNDKLCD